MLFVGIFVSRPIFGLFLALGFGAIFTTIVRRIVYGILERIQGRRSDYFDPPPRRVDDSTPTWIIDHQGDARQVRELTSSHYSQENPFMSLPKIVAAMTITLMIMFAVYLFGSTLITEGVLASVLAMLVGSITIWFIDVTKWQYQDHRIDPSAMGRI
tara:strand:- start:8250 stop:8720 length:471 start_codon:yes stop_codon:yes gene_type:complete